MPSRPPAKINIPAAISSYPTWVAGLAHQERLPVAVDGLLVECAMAQNYRVNRYGIKRSEHLDEATWAAIESHRQRVERAAANDDRPAVVGAAKELVECLARSVLLALGTTLGDNADFPKVVSTAHATLGMRPLELPGLDPGVRTIAQSANKMVQNVNEIRNDVGTGHGRARQPEIDDAMQDAVVDAAFLWVRWALAILDYRLQSQPSTLIAAVHDAISRGTLAKGMKEADLPTQLPDDQRAIGVAFGQQASGGFGNAYEVGVTPVEESNDLTAWPIEYRVGLAEGLLTNWEGKIGLTPWSAQSLARVLSPIPKERAEETLDALTEKVRESTWMSKWRGSEPDPATAVEALREEATVRLPELKDNVDLLCEALRPAIGSAL